MFSAWRVVHRALIIMQTLNTNTLDSVHGADEALQVPCESEWSASAAGAEKLHQTGWTEADCWLKTPGGR